MLKVLFKKVDYLRETSHTSQQYEIALKYKKVHQLLKFLNIFAHLKSSFLFLILEYFYYKPN